MNIDLETKIKAKIVDLAQIAIDESWTTIKAQMGQAALSASMADKRLKFPISIKAVLEPAGDDCGVVVSVSFGSRARLTMDRVNVSNQPEML